MSSTPGSTSGGGNDGGAANMWNFLIALVAAVALVFLTVFLVRHYTSVNDAATILGIVVPALAAAFGATVGYTVGDAKGKSDGETKAKSDIKAKLATPLAQADTAVGNLVGKIRTEGESSPGASTFSFAPDSLGDRRVDFDAADLQDAQVSIQIARSAVQDL